MKKVERRNGSGGEGRDWNEGRWSRGSERLRLQQCEGEFGSHDYVPTENVLFYDNALGKFIVI